jgi:hypothetical protein
MEFQDSIDQYRDTLKSISVKEASLQPGRDQKRKLRDSIERLQGSLSSMDKLNNLKEQLEQLEKFTEPDEIEMNNFKRIATREGLYLLLNGMHAMASKSDIISTFGKYIVDELDVRPVKPGEERQPYTGAEKTKRVVDDAKKAIDQWNPDKAKVRRTLTSHLGRNPLIVKQLPPVPMPEKTSPTPSATTSTSSQKPTEEAVEEEEEADVVVPNRTVSLEEQHKQYSFYKPDEVITVTEEEEQETQLPPTVYQPQLNPSPSTSSNTAHSGGFSSMYLRSPHLLPQPGLTNQQSLYQFYQHYLPPRSYEEMTSMFSPGAVFRASEENKKNDAGGFVLPSSNPNYLQPKPSTSTTSQRSTSSSVKSNNEES